jgi:hypothetical protein
MLGLKHSSLFASISDEEKQFYNIDTWGQCYKTFYVRNLLMFEIPTVIVPGKLFKPNPMLVGKASNLLWSGASFWCTTQVRSGLNCKHRLVWKSIQ